MDLVSFEVIKDNESSLRRWEKNLFLQKEKVEGMD